MPQQAASRHDSGDEGDGGRGGGQDANLDSVNFGDTVGQPIHNHFGAEEIVNNQLSVNQNVANLESNQISSSSFQNFEQFLNQNQTLSIQNDNFINRSFISTNHSESFSAFDNLVIPPNANELNVLNSAQLIQIQILISDRPEKFEDEDDQVVPG